MLGQDMVHTSTGCRIRTPEHVRLGITVHHLTGSKQLVILLNKIGHCCSFNDVELITTSLAREISAQSEQHGVIVPSNLSPGVFVQFATDSNDLNGDTLDGKHTTHATTRVAFGPELPPQLLADHSLKRRSLETPLSTQTIHDFRVHGRRPSVTLLGKVQNIGSSFEPRHSKGRLCLVFAEVKQTQLSSFPVMPRTVSKPFLVGVHLTPLFHLLLHKRGLLPRDSRIRQRIQHHLHCHENHTGYKCNTRTNQKCCNI